MKAFCEAGESQAAGVGLAPHQFVQRRAGSTFGLFWVVARVLAFRPLSDWSRLTIRMFRMEVYDASQGHRGADMQDCF